MIKTTIYLILFLISLLYFSFQTKKETTPSSIYEFKFKTLNGDVFDPASLRGNKILIVNTASKCGFTPQYKQLEDLYEKYKHQKFIILGFPCNQFGNQEPGSNKEIKEFCQKNYGVSFPMMEKTHVKGDSISEIYKWLTQKEKNGIENSTVQWNFQKYMIDENGRLVGHVSSFKNPGCAKIIRWIEGK